MRTLISNTTNRSVFGKAQDRAVVSTLIVRMILAVQHLFMRRHASRARSYRRFGERGLVMAATAVAADWHVASGLRLCRQPAALAPRPSIAG